MNFEEYYDTAFRILRNAHTELETLAAENQLIDEGHAKLRQPSDLINLWYIESILYDIFTSQLTSG